MINLFILSVFFSITFPVAALFYKDIPEKKVVASKNSVKEHVTFYAIKEEGSNERIGRKGILVKRDNAKATILILHGYSRDKFDVGPFRIFLSDYNCFTFDFRAHGEHIEDQCSTLGYDEIYDIFAAIDYLKSRPDLKDKPIFIFGFSMGAASAIEAQSLDPNLCQAMFLDAPFTSSVDVLHKILSKLKVGIWGYEFDLPGCGLLEKYAFNPYVQSIIRYLLKKIANVNDVNIETLVKPINPVESIKNITIPTYFVVCKNDSKSSPESVEQIYENANGYKRLWITNGREHCDSVFYDPEEYLKRLNNFFMDVITKKIYSQDPEIVLIDKDEVVVQ
ncbi:MAG: alpha/beta hydrolase [Candidatus Babeliales bacterium]|nr:alpha/beta hydrolase [Candidatus Babeliales bacterium]